MTYIELPSPPLPRMAYAKATSALSLYEVRDAETGEVLNKAAPLMLQHVPCLNCQASPLPRRGAKFCSRRCRMEWNYRRRKAAEWLGRQIIQQVEEPSDPEGNP